MSSLPLQNPWWRDGTVRPELLREFRRSKFSELVGLMDSRQIVLISGLRRVGKSTIMMQLIQWLISEKHVDPLEIVYFSFDEKVENIQRLLKNYGELTSRHYDEGRLYLFLDGIQKLENWSEQVKLLYDALPKIKFVLSGSAALPLEREAKSILAGRMFTVTMKPLSFREFLRMKYQIEIKSEDELRLWRDKMPSYFSEYLKRSMPETVEMPENLIRRYTKESIVERIDTKTYQKPSDGSTRISSKHSSAYFLKTPDTFSISILWQRISSGARGQYWTQ